METIIISQTEIVGAFGMSAERLSGPAMGGGRSWRSTGLRAGGFAGNGAGSRRVYRPLGFQPVATGTNPAAHLCTSNAVEGSMFTVFGGHDVTKFSTHWGSTACSPPV